MATIIPLATRDPRVRSRARITFPDSPELVDFLVEQMGEHGSHQVLHVLLITLEEMYELNQRTRVRREAVECWRDELVDSDRCVLKKRLERLHSGFIGVCVVTGIHLELQGQVRDKRTLENLIALLQRVMAMIDNLPQLS